MTTLLTRMRAAFRRSKVAQTTAPACTIEAFPNCVLPPRDTTTRIRFDIPRLRFRPAAPPERPSRPTPPKRT